MRKGILGLLLISALLAGCTTGAATPESGVDGLLKQARRDLKTSVDLIAKVPLKNGGEFAVFSYKKGDLCGTGYVDGPSGAVQTQEGACDDPISPGQARGDESLIVYGYLPPMEVGKIILRWEDGSEAEAKLGESAFFYVAEGADLPPGEVSLTAYDRQGKVIQAAPTGQKKHHH